MDKEAGISTREERPGAQACMTLKASPQKLGLDGCPRNLEKDGREGAVRGVGGTTTKLCSSVYSPANSMSESASVQTRHCWH